MRTFGQSLGTVAIIASITVPSTLSAQRNAHRPVRKGQVSAAAARQSRPVRQDAPGCGASCDDYSLAVVSAVLPANPVAGSHDVVTLVIENRGGISAPASRISVAPRNHLTLASVSSLPALAPGERATIQLPVVIAADGTPCISITIAPAPVIQPSAAQFLASTGRVPVSPSAAPPAIDTGGIWTGLEGWSDSALSAIIGSGRYSRTIGAW